MNYYNPVAMINERDCNNVNNNFGGNARITLNIKPIEGLRWDNFIALGKDQYESREYYTHYYPSMIGTDGKAYISISCKTIRNLNRHLIISEGLTSIPYRLY